MLERWSAWQPGAGLQRFECGQEGTAIQGRRAIALLSLRSRAGLTHISAVAKLPNMDSVFKAMADPTRRRILELLREREMTAGELAEQFELSKSTLSGHFSVLREAGLVSSEKSGTSITYRLNLSVLEEAVLGFSQAMGLGLRGASPRRRRHA